MIQINYKTKNQIFDDFILLGQTALDNFGITKWEIRRLEQVFKINVLTPSIYLSVINSNQLGRQYITKTKTNETNSAKQEVKIRFSASRKERENDNNETYNGTDVLKIIRSFMQSKAGIKFLAAKGYAQYRAEQISEQNFMNDSENFQFLPYFDCTFLYTDTFTTEVEKITKIEHKLRRI